ncbi:MAG: YdeI/OmpD-associated family protein [Candidatus Margulisiibacteriota bacterium]
MHLGKTFYAADRKSWRSWLKKNHRQAKDVWLVYPKKHTGKPRVGYNDAVEEALCFGWIDSTVKKIDRDSYAQRFSPRKKSSKWSEPNLARMRRLIRLKRMTAAGLAALNDHTLLQESPKLKIAPAILKALKSDQRAWHNFHKFPPSYKRIRLAYIESGRRHGAAEFRKRLLNFLKKTREGKRFAFGGTNGDRD